MVFCYESKTFTIFIFCDISNSYIYYKKIINRGTASQTKNIMKLPIKEAATLVYDTLCIKSTCFDENHEIVNADYIVAIGDDPTSAVYAAKLCAIIEANHHYKPIIICVGGQGIISKHVHNCSEAQLLSMTCNNLLLKKTILLGRGCNIREHVLNVAKFLQYQPNSKIIWVTTKTLSLRLERTIGMQAPQLHSDYYVINESFKEAQKCFNGKGLANGEMLLHELSSILNSCEAYAGTYQLPLDFGISDELRKAAELLEKNYRINLPNKNWETYLQKIRLYFLILKNKNKMKKSLRHAINNMSIQIYIIFEKKM